MIFSVNDSVANRRVLTMWSYINLVISISKLLLEILTYVSCDFNNIIVRRMQNISITFFDHSSEKRDLNNNSNEGEAFKKSREGTLNTSTSSDITDDLFTESFKDPECVTKLLNCIKKIEWQITHIFSTTNELKETQIKSENHLQGLSNALDFISQEVWYIKTGKERQKRNYIKKELDEKCLKISTKCRWPLSSYGKLRAIFKA